MQKYRMPGASRLFQATTRSHARFSTSRRIAAAASEEASSPLLSHLMSGAAGGFIVVGAGYAYYRSSDLYTLVQKAKQASQLVEDAKSKVSDTSKTILNETKKAASGDSSAASFTSPTHAIHLIRQTVSPMVASIPGASDMLDQSLSTFEKFAKENAKEAEDMLRETYDELRRVFKEADGQFSIASAHKAYVIVQSAYQKIKDKVPSSVGDAAGKIMPKNMDIVKELSAAYPMLQGLLSSSDMKSVLEKMDMSQAKKWAEGLKERVASATKKHGNATEAILKDVQSYIRDQMPAKLGKAMPDLENLEDVKKLWQKWEGALPESLRHHPKLKEYMQMAQDMSKDLNAGQLEKMLKEWSAILKEKSSFSEMHQTVKPIIDQVKKINDKKNKDEDVSEDLKALLQHLANPKK